MGLEIDFLAVGEESSGGDAIALRYGNLHGSRHEQTVVVIDGGYKDCGASLVEHIRKHFGTERVDVVVSTHPDQDHSGGLTAVLENLDVGELWMHLPWNHSADLKILRLQHFKSQKLTERVEASLRSASDLEDLAGQLSIPIVEPFTGLQTPDGGLQVLGPTKERYEALLAEIPDDRSFSQRLVEAMAKGKSAIRNLIAETLSDETLSDGVTTSPRNNTSVISLVSSGDRHGLFTGDAGIASLEQACDELIARGIGPGGLDFVQIPHHGSRHNVGPTVLDRLLGPKGQGTTHSTAFVSAPKNNPELRHPHKKVTNAFTRRGYAVHATQGDGKCQPYDAPQRQGWTTAVPTPFYPQVEDDTD